MPRKETASWPLAADVETFFRAGPKQPGISPEILQFFRETADPSEWAEGRFIESEPREEQSLGTLPPVPDYVQPLSAIDLPGADWRTIVLHIMRRLAVRRADWAQEYARDIEIFAALKKVHALGNTEHPGYMDPVVLAVRLENNCPIIPELTHTKDMYLQYLGIRDALYRVPKRHWRRLLVEVIRDEPAGPIRLTGDQVRDILFYCHTPQQAGLAVIATLLGRVPKMLRQQFANAGLPLRPFTHREAKRPVKRPAKKTRPRTRSSR